jgi:hypothetical protein
VIGPDCAVTTGDLASGERQALTYFCEIKIVLITELADQLRALVWPPPPHTAHMPNPHDREVVDGLACIHGQDGDGI